MSAIYFDTETTGLRPKDGEEILQLSIIDEDGSTLYNGYFRPTGRTEWPNAEQINHISPAMVEKCPTFEDEREKIQAIFDDADLFIGYNTEFDMRFLQAQGIDFSRYKGEQVVDVMRDFAPIFVEKNDKYPDGYKWQKLTTCADYYGFDWSAVPAHNSLGDCLATLHCWRAMQERVLDKPVEFDIRYSDLGREPQTWYVNAIKHSGYFDYMQIDTERWDIYDYFKPVAIVKVYLPYVMAGTPEEVRGSIKRCIVSELEDRGCVEYNDYGSRFFVRPEKEKETDKQQEPPARKHDDYER